MSESIIKTCKSYLEAREIVRTSLKLLVGILWMTVASQTMFFLPFTLVPITLGPQAAIFLGLALGVRLAVSTLCLWVWMGMMGAPVFAGWGAFVGPTTGYLFGYIIAAHLMGHLMSKASSRRPLAIFLAALISHLPIYLLGLSWLAFFVSPGRVFALGFFPFVPGLFIKTGILSVVAARLYHRSQEASGKCS